MLKKIIIDRKEGAINYDPAKHLRAIAICATASGLNGICAAIDRGNEEDVKKALAAYVIVYGYDSALLDYIAGVRWTKESDEAE